MEILPLATAAIWVEFFTVVVSKYIFEGSAIKQWYNQFQYVAVLSDILSVIIGILLAHMVFPKLNLMIAAVIVQVIHDIFFATVVLGVIPTGHNSMIDIFKNYATESSYGILVADGIIITTTVLLTEYISKTKKELLILLALVGSYALTYIIYTNA
jgi:uncharacterized protein YacL